MRTILDLCSGLGGATRAFCVHPNSWRVIRVDNAPQHLSVPHTRHLDILNWLDWIDDLPSIDVVWCSPPCTEFSTAGVWRHGRPENPELDLVEACLAIIEYLNPRTWILENVHGACRYFRPLMGEHRQKVGPFYLWGNFPHIVMPFSWSHKKTDVRDPVLRAQIPLEVSEALLDALTNQQTLDDFV